MQAQMSASVPLEADWLDQSDASALAEALKLLISELIGWGEPIDDPYLSLTSH